MAHAPSRSLPSGGSYSSAHQFAPYYLHLPLGQYIMMYKNKNTIKAYKEKINLIQAAVEDAFAKDLIGREAYDLICKAVVRKMRKNV
jgi:hypothetical protein